MTQAVSPESIFKGNLDWHGHLNRATSDPSQFALFLAMHLQPGASPASFACQAAPATPSGLPANHYRRAPLTPAKNSVSTHHYPDMVADNDTANLLLWRAMHPEPLSTHDDPAHLTPEVVANCSFATQQRLQQPQPTQPVATDPGLLEGVVTGSQALLT